MMLEPSFEYLPTIDLLDHLVPGVLAQEGNLLKAVRLWVILRSLYGDIDLHISTDLNGWFSNAQWRDAFFSSTDRSFECDIRTKSLRQWLFVDCPELDEARLGRLEFPAIHHIA